MRISTWILFCSGLAMCSIARAQVTEAPDAGTSGDSKANNANQADAATAEPPPPNTTRPDPSLSDEIGAAAPQPGADDHPPPPSPSLTDEIDAAADESKKTAVTDASPTSIQSRPAASQSLNPDVSVILDSDVGWAKAKSYSLAGDDPDLRGNGKHPAGFTIQEAELALQAVVDPYFRGDLFLTIPNLNGIEVEEGFVTTTALPADLQLKAGIFRSAFGRQNGQHLHLQDFTRRPLINEAFLGEDGLRAPGVQLSWLLPTPFFLQLSTEVFSAKAPDAVEHLTTFGGGKRTDFTYTAELEFFVPAGESLSFYGGLNEAWGTSAGVPWGKDGPVVLEGASTWLQGLDLYLKYKPPNVAGSYFSLAWTTEYFLRQVAQTTSAVPRTRDGGLYSQVVVQVARRWFVGLRQDLLGLPASILQARVSRTALSLTLAFSEFARLRTYVERETLPSTSQLILAGTPNFGCYLQLEVSLGAHGAHPF